MRKTRLFINSEIAVGNAVEIMDGDFEYLTKVLRKKIADEIFVFNGVSGEFRSVIKEIKKRSLILEILEKSAELKKSPNITLAFSLIKNVKIDVIATKATELGVSCFQPIITKRTVIDKVNVERFKANIKEACEQCERNDFPEVREVKKLEKFLSDEKTANKILILCDESGNGMQAKEILPKIEIKKDQEIVVLIGPEGGFAEEEFVKMKQLKNLYSMSLGPRILRADTAMFAALTLVQEFLGDFDLKPC
ncbi:MAG: 16S rRNA (uracil(1498)-N(3))-methyltransferase [Rickettsiales bacterium]|nr:16S rRNA (uracil(1498)-N(3))-methyltransferase [Rickettsiales bacterium]